MRMTILNFIIVVKLSVKVHIQAIHQIVHHLKQFGILKIYVEQLFAHQIAI